MKKTHKIGVGALILYAAGSLILVSTNPQQLSPILLLVPFLIFFGALLVTAVYVEMLFTKRNWVNKKSLLEAAMIAGFPMFLLLLQSVGQLSIRDILTLVLLLGFFVFYIVRTRSGSKSI